MERNDGIEGGYQWRVGEEAGASRGATKGQCTGEAEAVETAKAVATDGL